MKAACILILLSLLAVEPCPAQTSAPSAAAPITMDAIQQDFDSQHYSDVIRKTIAALQVKGPNAAQFDRVKLYALKGEAHLHLKQYMPAADTFALAAKEATDEKEIAKYQSTSLLIHRSLNGQYTPKPAPSTQPVATNVKPVPIGIIDETSRKRAMGALFEDELRTETPKVAAVNQQQALPPLMSAINEVRDLRRLEMTATGHDSSSTQLFASIETHAGLLLTSAIKSMSTTVEKISKAANSGTTSYGPSPYGGNGQRTILTKNGLTSNDAATLNDVIDTCKKIQGACDELTQALPSSTSKAENSIVKVNANAAKLAAKADEVLHANYEADVNDAPGLMVLPN